MAESIEWRRWQAWWAAHGAGWPTRQSDLPVPEPRTEPVGDESLRDRMRAWREGTPTLEDRAMLAMMGIRWP